MKSKPIVQICFGGYISLLVIKPVQPVKSHSP